MASIAIHPVLLFLFAPYRMDSFPVKIVRTIVKEHLLQLTNVKEQCYLI